MTFHMTGIIYGAFPPSRSGKSLSKLREKNKIRVIHDDLKVWRDLFRKWDNPLRREVNLFEWIWDTGKKKFSRNSRSLSRHPSFQRRTIISCIPAIYHVCTPFFLAGFAHERGNALICIGFANVGTRDPDPVYRIIPLVKKTDALAQKAFGLFWSEWSMQLQIEVKRGSTV